MPSPRSPLPLRFSWDSCSMSCISGATGVPAAPAVPAAVWARAVDAPKKAIESPSTPRARRMVIAFLLRSTLGARARRVAIGQVGPARAGLGIQRLVAGQLVVLERGMLIALVVIEPCIVAAEHRGLHRSVGRSQRRQAVLLLQR